MLPFLTPISPWEIVEAYKEIGLNPTQSTYYVLRNKKKPKVCGLVALYCKHMRDIFSISSFNKKLLQGIMDTIEGDEDDYFSGFVHGWDGDDPECKSKKYKQGYKNGKAAWEAVSK